MFPYVIETLVNVWRTQNSVETLALRARVPILQFLVLPNFHSCFSNYGNTPYFFMIIMGIYSIVLPTNPYFKISRRAYERLLTTCIENCKNVNLSHSSSHYKVYLYHAPANYKLVVIRGEIKLGDFGLARLYNSDER